MTAFPIAFAYVLLLQDLASSVLTASVKNPYFAASTETSDCDNKKIWSWVSFPPSVWYVRFLLFLIFVSSIAFSSSSENALFIKLFDELSGEAYDPITKIYPGEYKISIPAIGTKVTRSNDKDGGYTIKALIGVNKKTYNEDEIVKKIKKAENNLNQVKGMRSVLMADGDKESFDLTKKFEKKPEIILIGYYETKYDENGKLISKNGRIGFLLRWEASKTVQYISATPPIPLLSIEFIFNTLVPSIVPLTPI